MYEGSMSDPATLHKYTYAGGEAVNSFDPSGHLTLKEQAFSMAVRTTLFTLNGINAGLSLKRSVDYFSMATRSWRNGEFWDGLAFGVLSAVEAGSAIWSIVGAFTATKMPPSASALLSLGSGGAAAVWQGVVANPALANWVIRTAAPILFSLFLNKIDDNIEIHHKVPYGNSEYDFQNHDLVKASGWNLKDEIRNLMLLGNHKGRHSKSYLEAIKSRLDAALEKVAQKRQPQKGYGASDG